MINIYTSLFCSLVFASGGGGGGAAKPAHTAEPAVKKVREIDPGREVVVVEKTNKIVKVPKSFWTFLKAKLTKEGMTEKSFIEAQHIKVPLHIELTEKTNSVFRGKNYLYQFKDGEGELEFANLITKKRGDFTVKFIPLDQDENDLTGYHLFFISFSKQRDEIKQKWGNGCGKILDLTNSKSKFESEILLTVSKQHYVSAMAGMFIIAKYEKDKLYLSQVEFIDKRYPHLYCDFVRQL